MNLADTPFFGLLRQRLDQLSERQRLISENIANSNTPGYQPRDLDTAGFERMMAEMSDGEGHLRMARTNASHMAAGGAGAGAAPRVITRPDSETTIDGNSVVLEDQMTNAAQTRMSFETSLALYQKGLQLMRMAIKAPGR